MHCLCGGTRAHRYPRHHVSCTPQCHDALCYATAECKQASYNSHGRNHVHRREAQTNRMLAPYLLHVNGPPHLWHFLTAECFTFHPAHSLPTLSLTLISSWPLLPLGVSPKGKYFIAALSALDLGRLLGTVRDSNLGNRGTVPGSAGTSDCPKAAQALISRCEGLSELCYRVQPEHIQPSIPLALTLS